MWVHRFIPVSNFDTVYRGKLFSVLVFLCIIFSIIIVSHFLLKLNAVIFSLSCPCAFMYSRVYWALVTVIGCVDVLKC